MMHDDAAAPLAGSDRPRAAHKCLVMTGGTSGIGRRALRTLLGERPEWTVILLAHYLIVEHLKGLLRPGGRIVMTSSEVHDPDVFCLMGIGRATWQDPLMLADPERSQEHVPSVVDRGEARYCASKLLNLMHARHLAQELPGIGVVAFNPSVVPGTEIGRDRNWLQKLGWKYIMPVLAPILPGARSVSRSASDLLWLMTEADARALSGQYVDG